MEKSPAALGMNIDEYADVSITHFTIQYLLWNLILDDVSAWRWDFEKEEITCATITRDGVKIIRGVTYE